VRRTVLHALALSGFAFSAALPAQRQPLPPPGQAEAKPAAAAPAEEEPLASLILLPSQRVPVRYAADTLDRAARLQLRLDAIHELLQPLVADPLGWRAAAVTEEEWKALGIGRPWGVAARSPKGIFLVPAAGDPATVATARRLLGGGLPPFEGRPVYGTAEEASSLVLSDALLQIEVARSFLKAAAIHADAPWLDGVLAHLVARLAWEVNEPDRVLATVGLFDRIAAAQGGAAAKPLAAFAPGMPYEPSLWYEAQFVRGADAIWVEEGRRGTVKLLKRAIRDRRQLQAVTLEKKYPALAAWRAAAFAP